MAKVISIIEVMNKTADLIDEKGLAKFVQEDPMGQLCLIGGFNVAIFGKPFVGIMDERLPEESETRPTHERFRETIKAFGKFLASKRNWGGPLSGNGPDDIWRNAHASVSWNNHNDRTKKEVVDALRECAQDLKAAA
jgi:hypothetical protein